MSALGQSEIAPAAASSGSLPPVPEPIAGRQRRAILHVLWRYCVATVGPIGSAVAQFVLSIVLLHTLSSEAFGSSALLLIVSQFSTGVIGALFCAPLPVLMAIDNHTLRA